MSDTKGDLHAPGERGTRTTVASPPAAPAPGPRSVGAPPPSVDSVRDHEDFLFHLYRGSELLQENRVLEAKEEIEYALTLQPKDSKGQDLLAAVYFRLGLYPRAISIYENLLGLHPGDPSLQLNLSLCYLKTGQPDAARTTLADLVRRHPDHRRAWGYLGIVLEKVGDFDHAEIAFERGGHPAMARRMAERRSRATVPAPPVGRTSASGEELREAFGVAFEELDAGMAFSLAEPGTGRSSAGTWHAIELGSIHSPTLPPPSMRAMPATRPDAEPMIIEPGGESLTLSPPAPPEPPPPRAEPLGVTVPPPADFDYEVASGRAPTPAISRPPPAIAAEAARAKVVFPAGSLVAVHPSGLVLVQTATDGPHGARPFAARLEAVRVSQGTLHTTLLQRRVRDKATQEVLGGMASPLVEIRGNADLVLGARNGHRLFPLELHDDVAFVREDLLLGFELTLAYENGRISHDEGEPIAVVQLRGTGTLVLELLRGDGPLAAHAAYGADGGALPHGWKEGFLAIECAAARTTVVKREWVIGWIGHLLPRPIPFAEAPAGQRGLVSFTGEGTVLVAQR